MATRATSTCSCKIDLKSRAVRHAFLGTINQWRRDYNLRLCRNCSRMGGSEKSKKDHMMLGGPESCRFNFFIAFRAPPPCLRPLNFGVESATPWQIHRVPARRDLIPCLHFHIFVHRLCGATRGSHARFRRYFFLLWRLDRDRFNASMSSIIPSKSLFLYNHKKIFIALDQPIGFDAPTTRTSLTVPLNTRLAHAPLMHNRARPSKNTAFYNTS